MVLVVGLRLVGLGLEEWASRAFCLRDQSRRWRVVIFSYCARGVGDPEMSSRCPAQSGQVNTSRGKRSTVRIQSADPARRESTWQDTSKYQDEDENGAGRRAKTDCCKYISGLIKLLFPCLLVLFTHRFSSSSMAAVVDVDVDVDATIAGAEDDEDEDAPGPGPGSITDD
jgi:hypothetical protein